MICPSRVSSNFSTSVLQRPPRLRAKHPACPHWSKSATEGSRHCHENVTTPFLNPWHDNGLLCPAYGGCKQRQSAKARVLAGGVVGHHCDSHSIDDLESARHQRGVEQWQPAWGSHSGDHRKDYPGVTVAKYSSPRRFRHKIFDCAASSPSSRHAVRVNLSK